MTCNHYDVAQLRAADRQLPGHRRGPDPGRRTTSTCAHLLADAATGRCPGDAAERRDAHLPRRRRLRGPLRLPRHAHRPDLGRRHVRGADAPALRARGALGPALVGRQPPALRARPDRARPRRGALRLLGLLARPTTRPAATAPTASTRSACKADGYPSNNDNTFVDHGFGDCRPAKPDPPPSAYTNGVVTPHASFLALRYAPRAALANLAQAALALRRLRQGRLLRRRQRRHRPGRRAPTSRSTRAWSWPRPPTR